MKKSKIWDIFFPEFEFEITTFRLKPFLLKLTENFLKCMNSGTFSSHGSIKCSFAIKKIRQHTNALYPKSNISESLSFQLLILGKKVLKFCIFHGKIYFCGIILCKYFFLSSCMLVFSAPILFIWVAVYPYTLWLTNLIVLRIMVLKCSLSPTNVTVFRVIRDIYDFKSTLLDLTLLHDSSI